MALFYVRCVVVAGVAGVLLMSTVSSSPAARHRRSDDGGPLEAVVVQLSQQVSLLTAEVTAWKAKTDNLDKAVAFYAKSSAGFIQTTDHGALILDTAVSNIGNAYNTRTGVFTAPYSGVYDLQMTIMSHIGSGYVDAGIYVDTREVAHALSDNRQGGNLKQITSRAIVHVNAGSEVSVRNDDVAKQYYGGSFTTFSGFLLKAD